MSEPNSAFELLVEKFGDASFLCGEFDPDGLRNYMDVLQRKREYKQAVLDAYAGVVAQLNDAWSGNEFRKLQSELSAARAKVAELSAELFKWTSAFTAEVDRNGELIRKVAELEARLSTAFNLGYRTHVEELEQRIAELEARLAAQHPE